MKARQAAPSALAQALRTEQSYVTALYERLDTLREREEEGLSAVLRDGAHGGTRQALVEREVRAEEQARSIARFNGVEGGLCFGRIDHADHAGGASHYIGRIGLRDDAHEPLLVDWRAPAARPFYAASPTAPGTLVRRRHLHTRGRRVTGVDDEVFDLDGIGEAEQRGLVGEAALLAALRRGRTGRMTDVVATIQTEQDRVIRSGLQGVLVVQGGPGTGKTVAALHRAAYLLYTYRDTLARRGVLIIGPGAAFLHYIGQVLPSLGETDVVLTPLGGLFPGVSATAEDGARAAVVKGDPRMAEVIAAAVRGRQLPPAGHVDIPLEDEALPLRLSRQACAHARERAQALHAPHNVARKRFVLDLLDALVRERARQHRRPLDEEELRHGPAELWAQPPVRAALDALWPPLTPQRLVADLLSDAGRLRSAAPLLTDDERAALLRVPDAPWTVGDVPLLDEAAELLGTDDSAERARARAAEEERREGERYAREVLQIVGLDEVADEGEGEGPVPVDAAALAARHLDSGPVRSTAQRAAADRSWAYGHVIVDEAQELSAMAWRMVMRRVPTRSMTVVGDVAQTGSPAGANSWGQMLDPYTRGGWREERLTVNYRTPAEVMDLAADVLAEAAPGLSAPESVRREGRRPLAVRAPRGRLAREVTRAVEADLADLAEQGGGRLAVVAADRAVRALARALPDAVRGDRPDALDSPLVLLTVAQAKGLEFDRAVVADPAGIRSQSPKGGHDLYVAITRVTRRLTVVYEGELPEVLGRLAP
ncbi:HelD family protein [Streptomyces sp. LZ34]